MSKFLALVVLIAAPSARADAPLEEQRFALERRIADAPWDLSLRLRLVDLETRLGSLRRALEDVRIAEVAFPRESRLPVLEAEILLLSERPAEAEAILDSIIAGPGRHRHAYRVRGRAREALSDRVGAAEDYGAALLLGPDVEIYLARGRLLEGLRRWEDGLQNYRQGLRETGATPIRRALITIQTRMGRLDAAIAHVDVLVSQAQVATRFLVLRASLLERQGRSAEARRDRELALAQAEALYARRPSPLALMERGRARLALGQRAAAREDLERASRQAPQLFEARDLLSRLAGAGR